MIAICNRPTTGGPCARSRGHRTDRPCEDAATFAAHLTRERSTILAAANAVLRFLLTREMRGTVVLLGPPALRQAATLVVRDAGHPGRPLHQKIAGFHTSDMAPGATLALGALNATALCLLLAPALRGHPDPCADFAARFAAWRAHGTHGLLCIDDIDAIARSGFDATVPLWLRDHGAASPLLLCTSPEGWGRFLCAAAQAGAVDAFRGAYVVSFPQESA